jgi:hypothetical protein
MDEVPHKGNGNVDHHLNKKHGSSHEHAVPEVVCDCDGRAKTEREHEDRIFLENAVFDETKVIGFLSL